MGCSRSLLSLDLVVGLSRLQPGEFAILEFTSEDHKATDHWPEQAAKPRRVSCQLVKLKDQILSLEGILSTILRAHHRQYQQNIGNSIQVWAIVDVVRMMSMAFTICLKTNFASAY